MNIKNMDIYYKNDKSSKERNVCMWKWKTR